MIPVFWPKAHVRVLWVPKRPNCLICPSVRVPYEYPPGSLQVPSVCLSDLRVPWIFEWTLSIFKCALLTRISDQMWLEMELLSIKRYLYKKVYKKDQNDRSDFEEFNFRAKSERWFKKLLGLAIQILFLQRVDFDLCVGTFIWNFRLTLMFLALPLNKKSSTEISFRRICVSL